jgi:hypothetical protein
MFSTSNKFSELTFVMNSVENKYHRNKLYQTHDNTLLQK